MPTPTLAMALALAATGCGDGDDSGMATTGDEQPGHIAVEPDTIDVGDLALHEEGSGWITIQNSGEGLLRVYDVQMADDRMWAFWSLEGDKTFRLAPGDTAQLVAVANPGDITDLSARLEVLSDDPLAPVTYVLLRGTSHGAPAARITPSLVDLGSVAVGDATEVAIVIANDGSAGLTVSNTTLVEALTEWTISLSPTGTTVAPQSEDGRVMVKFAPREVGVSGNTLEIYTNDPDASPATITLVGVGI